MCNMFVPVLMIHGLHQESKTKRCKYLRVSHFVCFLDNMADSLLFSSCAAIFFCGGVRKRFYFSQNL